MMGVMRTFAKLALIWLLILLVGWHQRGWIDWLGGAALLPLMAAAVIGIREEKR